MSLVDEIRRRIYFISWCPTISQRTFEIKVACETISKTFAISCSVENVKKPSYLYVEIANINYTKQSAGNRERMRILASKDGKQVMMQYRESKWRAKFKLQSGRRERSTLNFVIASEHLMDDWMPVKAERKLYDLLCLLESYFLRSTPRLIKSSTAIVASGKPVSYFSEENSEDRSSLDITRGEEESGVEEDVEFVDKQYYEIYTGDVEVDEMHLYNTSHQLPTHDVVCSSKRDTVEQIKSVALSSVHHLHDLNESTKSSVIKKSEEDSRHIRMNTDGQGYPYLRFIGSNLFTLFGSLFLYYFLLFPSFPLHTTK